MVRARLTAEDDSVAPKPQWPTPKQCKLCYASVAELTKGGGPQSPAGTNEKITAAIEKEAAALVAAGPILEWSDSTWSFDYLFAYLQVILTPLLSPRYC